MANWDDLRKVSIAEERAREIRNEKLTRAMVMHTEWTQKILAVYTRSEYKRISPTVIRRRKRG